MKLSFSTKGWHDSSFEDFCQIANDLKFKGIEEFRNNKVFVFSDIQKLIAVLGALFFFAVFVSELTPVIAKIVEKISFAFTSKGGI